MGDIACPWSHLAVHRLFTTMPALEAVQAAKEQSLSAGEQLGRALIDQMGEARDGPVKGSPHLFCPDGTDAHNPGIEMHWEGEHGVGFPVIDRDDPSVYDDLLKRAAG